MIQGAENAKSEWEKMGDAIEEAEDKVKLASLNIDPDDTECTAVRGNHPQF